MSSRIEDYALIGDCQTAALVARDGSIDWLCAPRFDSPACFAALLGSPEHGRWLVAPDEPERKVERRCREGTLVLETSFETDDGTVAVIDFMPPRSEVPDLVRLVEGRRGRVPMRMELVIRFDYGSVVPSVRRVDRGISAIAGPDLLTLRTDVEPKGVDFKTIAEFTVAKGQRIPFVLTWHPSHRPRPSEVDAMTALDETERWWRDWSLRRSEHGEWCEAVRRSLITLKALTYSPTGGMVAAVTTSLPEQLGGVRNWDYRFCWLRDATFTLYSLMLAGYHEEASAWREWLLRAVAGSPSQMHIMYGLAGERRLTELELPWLPGYEGSAPVRIGNAAVAQHQLDVYGEVMDSLHQCRRHGLDPGAESWRLQAALIDFLESDWRRPDEGIWEVRGPRRHFTHSKVMAWVAFDRAVKAIEMFGLDGPVDRWRALRDEVHAQVCRDGYDPEMDAFVQSYGSKHLDASLLMIPLVGFLPASDPRMRGTVAAIERVLVTDGFVNRYTFDPNVDGLPPGEGAFLLCTFWLADTLALMGRRDDARRIFDGLLAIRNDVGLLPEAYDPFTGRHLGNFPQAFSHVGLINTAYNLAQNVTGPADDRPQSGVLDCSRPSSRDLR
jgi:GH15 family glucan-1,4-alpha-glucosidase